MKESARAVLHRFLRLEVNDFLDDDRDAGGVVEVATAAWGSPRRRWRVPRSVRRMTRVRRRSRRWDRCSHACAHRPL
jgi:hypothetical protein